MQRIIYISRLHNKQLYRTLSLFTRKQVRGLANSYHIPLGLNKECTLFNLVSFRHKLKNLKIQINLN